MEIRSRWKFLFSRPQSFWTFVFFWRQFFDPFSTFSVEQIFFKNSFDLLPMFCNQFCRSYFESRHWCASRWFLNFFNWITKYLQGRVVYIFLIFCFWFLIMFLFYFNEHKFKTKIIFNLKVLFNIYLIICFSLQSERVPVLESPKWIDWYS